MKISKKYPPNYRQVVDILGADDTTVYCYGDTIYNPNNIEITPDIEVHEEVHSKQQGDNPELWCLKYLNDKEFRQQSEVEAYGAQYFFVKNHLGGGKMLEWLLDKLADELSSSCYNLDINQAQAKSKIRNEAKKGN